MLAPGHVSIWGPNLIPDIPNFVYTINSRSHTTLFFAWRNEGPNAARAVGYFVWHIVCWWSGNILNYVARYEALTNFNFHSQRFVMSFIMTHNVWVQFIASSNTVFIFNNNPWQARLTFEPHVAVTACNISGNGFFTHYSTSSISQAAWMPRIVRAAIAWVPRSLGQKSAG